MNDARIFVDQDDDDIGIFIDSESAANQGLVINAKYCGYFVQDISGGYGIAVARDIAEAGSQPLVAFTDDHTSGTQSTLRVRHDGTGVGALALEVVGRVRLGDRAAAIQSPMMAWIMS